MTAKVLLIGKFNFHGLKSSKLKVTGLFVFSSMDANGFCS